MEYWDLFFTALVVGFSGAMMPGPMLTVNINESIRRGAQTGFWLVLGHVVLELALVIGLILGLSGIFKNSGVTAGIAIIGGGFLLWMGWDMVKSALKGTVSLDLEVTGESKGSGTGPFLSGLLTSLSNPYWSLWWATVGLGFLVSAQKLGGMGVGAFFTGHILADFIWYGAVSLAVAKGKQFMTDKIYRSIITVCGGFLIYLAGMFVTNGIKLLMT